MPKHLVTNQDVSRVLLDCLRDGATVKIDELGIFGPGAAGRFHFEPIGGLRIFLAYVVEDKEQVMQLYDTLADAGFSPWMDTRRLLAGQNWPRAIEQAIRGADIFMPCFSSRATKKRGQFQAELRFAMGCAALNLIDETYLMPVRLNECEVPAVISGSIQYVDLFPEWGEGMRRLVKALSVVSRREEARY